jgi:thiamine biosynthesis lipoprotein ApbE
MNRRAFLKLPALLPIFDVGSLFGSAAYHFEYESVIGTSLDLVVSSPSSRVAEGACQTVRQEITRLASILDTRDPTSEISLFENAHGTRVASPELADVLNAYDYWERRTGGVFSIHPEGAGTRRNVDALGKAYIIDRAAAAALKAWPSIDALSLNVGGDIVLWGRSCEIAIADPGCCYDNAPPIATINLHNAAVATSGTYARGAHLIDSRTGQAPGISVAATVVAADAVTANALATTWCLTGADQGLQLVESTPGAEGLRVAAGLQQRTSGFVHLERRGLAQTPAPTQWPAGYQVTIPLQLTRGRSRERPYVAVWVEDASGKLVRALAVWGTKPKYQQSLSTLWARLQGNYNLVRSVTRATRSPGKYELVWDGLDSTGKPVPLGSYVITVETSQEHGVYAKQAGTIDVGDSPASVTLPATTNFDAVLVQYGPRVAP